MSLFDRTYERAPIWLQQAIVATYGVWWFHRRFGRAFRRYVAELETRNHWTAADHEAHQALQLGTLLAAARRSSYYGPLLSAIPENTPPREQLARLPLLSKQTLRTRAKDLLTSEPPRGTAVFRSSGTTGTPTDIYFEHTFHQLVQAYFEVRNRAWGGVTYRDRRVMFGVRKVCRYDQAKPPFWRFSPVEHLAYMSIYHLSDRFMGAYADFLAEYQPRVVMGYPNSLYTLAEFMNRTGRTMPPATAIITTSETVTPTIREACERAFGCKIYDNYCAVEACMLATQCEHGRYHLSPDFGVFEILDENGQPCPPGVVGRAICTGLNNLLQPLIRYDIGDAVAWSEETACPCGRELPMIRSIEGRIEDMCFTRDGRAVLRFDTVFKGVASIREAQVIQEAIDRFTIRVATDTLSAEDRATLLANMRKHVGEVHTDIVVVPSIERTAAGKFRPVISRLRAKT
jgi:phenylacetate-CoA ligase